MKDDKVEFLVTDKDDLCPPTVTGAEVFEKGFALGADTPIYVSTNTTGLGVYEEDKPDHAIELAIVDDLGNVLFNKRFTNFVAIDGDASLYHGICDGELLVEEPMTVYYEEIAGIIRGKNMYFYNDSFHMEGLMNYCRYTGSYNDNPFNFEYSHCLTVGLPFPHLVKFVDALSFFGLPLPKSNSAVDKAVCMRLLHGKIKERYAEIANRPDDDIPF